MKEFIPALLMKAFDYIPMETFDANPQTGNRELPLSCMSVRHGIHLSMRVPNHYHTDDGGNGLAYEEGE